MRLNFRDSLFQARSSSLSAQFLVERSNPESLEICRCFLRLSWNIWRSVSFSPRHLSFESCFSVSGSHSWLRLRSTDLVRAGMNLTPNIFVCQTIVLLYFNGKSSPPVAAVGVKCLDPMHSSFHETCCFQRFWVNNPFIVIA
jgi:hypothetical protein